MFCACEGSYIVRAVSAARAVSELMLQSRQAMQVSGLTQEAAVSALGPRCSMQPGHAQEGPHPQVDGVMREFEKTLPEPIPGHCPNGVVGLEASLRMFWRLAGDVPFSPEYSAPRE